MSKVPTPLLLTEDAPELLNHPSGNILRGARPNQRVANLNRCGSQSFQRKSQEGIKGLAQRSESLDLVGQPTQRFSGGSIRKRCAVPTIIVSLSPVRGFTNSSRRTRPCTSAPSIPCSGRRPV
jgi:hypothetical protein